MFSIFRHLFGTTAPAAPLSDPTERCDDCEASEGQLHALFCTRESCPFCGNQLASCDCIHAVLKLNPEESHAVDEYVDDEVEPLKSVVTRWKAVLNERGRIPFRGRKLESSTEDLILMAARGQLDAVKRLLSAGIPVDAPNEVNYTALMAAARNSNVDIVRHLLKAGADVSLRDAYGHTALHCAVGSPSSRSIEQAQADCVQLLLAAGADPNAATPSGSTPLGSAAWFGCGPAVLLLLKAGANPAHRDNQGRTPADLAKTRGHQELLPLLS